MMMMMMMMRRRRRRRRCDAKQLNRSGHGQRFQFLGSERHAGG
jgi:hypothetical protein